MVHDKNKQLYFILLTFSYETLSEEVMTRVDSFKRFALSLFYAENSAKTIWQNVPNHLLTCISWIYIYIVVKYLTAFSC